jgi:hypothetical protein
MRWLPLAAFLIAGCLNPVPDVTGKSCSTAQDCGAGYECPNGTCQPTGSTGGGSGGGGGDADGGSNNILTNGDLEHGEASEPIEGWRAFGGSVLTPETIRVHSGAHSIRVAKDVAGGTPGLEPSGAPVQNAAFGTKLCVSAWATGSSQGRQGKIQFREYNSDGGSKLVDGPTLQFNDQWVVASGSYVTQGYQNFSIRIWVENPNPNDPWFVDDIALSVSRDGGCQ